MATIQNLIKLMDHPRIKKIFYFREPFPGKEKITRADLMAYSVLQIMNGRKSFFLPLTLDSRDKDFTLRDYSENLHPDWSHQVFEKDDKIAFNPKYASLFRSLNYQFSLSHILCHPRKFVGLSPSRESIFEYYYTIGTLATPHLDFEVNINELD